jgi:hypothetical protein
MPETDPEQAIAGGLQRRIFHPLNDEPTLEIDSLLPRQRLLEQLRQALLSCTPPQVVGIHGDWGSGKTSFLHRLMFEITGECLANSAAEQRASASIEAEKKKWDESKAIAVWFEAWRYQHEDLPVVALLNEIRSRFSRPRKFWIEAQKLAVVATTSALFGIDAITKYVGMRWRRGIRSSRLPLWRSRPSAPYLRSWKETLNAKAIFEWGFGSCGFFRASVKKTYLTLLGLTAVFACKIKGFVPEKNRFREAVKNPAFLLKWPNERALLPGRVP